MTYIGMKIGTKYITFTEEGEFKLVKSTKEATLWPIDMKSQVEEGLDKIRESGLNARLVMILGTGE